ncbi:MAG: carbonate dehydratase [Gammaproteobacteria bacterium]|nr:carbonate dehydratase [Gammaproteobacteria bacterium]
MLDHLFHNNRLWSERMKGQDPAFFKKLLDQQTPEYLWIGCADSRVPANEIVDLMPGELFVHRNVANVVVHTDLNCLSVLQYAVDVLKVKHVIVCGHYGCGGIRAALNSDRLGLIDNWLRHVQDVRKKYEKPLLSITDSENRSDKLCELNVVEQVANVCETTIIQDAWARGQPVDVHGWIYGLGNGRLRDLGIRVAEREQLPSAYDAAVATLLQT